MTYQEKKKRIVFFLVILVTLGQFGVDLYLPSLPFIAQDLHTSVTLIKLTIPLYLIGFGSSQLIYGPLSDAIGRKPILIFGVSVFLLGSLGCLFAFGPISLLIFRSVQGLGIGAAIVNVRAIMRDAFHGKQMAKISSWIVMIWSVTPIVAPVLGGYIQHFFHWRGNFATMFLYALFIGASALFFLPETLDKLHKKKRTFSEILQSYKKIFKDRVFLAFSLMSSFCYGYFISYISASPFLFQTQLGLTPVQYGWVILLIALGTAIGSILSSVLLTYFKMIQIILFGSFVMVLATIVMLLLASFGIFTILSILIPPFFGSLGGGLIFPNCTAGALTHYKTKAGIAGASLGFIQMFNSFIFSMIISHLSTKTALPLSCELLAISILIFLLFFLYIRPHFIEELDPQ